MSTIELICTVIGGVALILGALWFIIQRVFKLGIDRGRLEHVEQKMSNLPCDNHQNKISASESDRTSLKESIDRLNKSIVNLPCDHQKEQILNSKKNHEDLHKIVISTNEMVTEISKWVMRIDADMINKLVKKNSPFKITPVGKVIFEKSGAKKVMDENIDKLINMLEGTYPKTPYDVEDNASNILIQNVGDDLFNDIKNYLYYSPDKIKVIDPNTGTEIHVSLSIHAIIKVMSIYLRDKYFEKHPELNTSNFQLL